MNEKLYLPDLHLIGHMEHHLPGRNRATLNKYGRNAEAAGVDEEDFMPYSFQISFECTQRAYWISCCYIARWRSKQIY